MRAAVDRSLYYYNRKGVLCLFHNTPVFYSVMPKCDSPLGRTDLEQKALADKREAYKRTLSEETTVE